MNLNEIKKALYKEKPTARVTNLDSTADRCEYRTDLADGTEVVFDIPMKEALDFMDEEPAQLLIRWIKI